MKKQLLFLALCLSSSWGTAQSFYTGSVHEAPYQGLDNTVQLEESTQSPGFYYYTLPEIFSFFDIPTSNILSVGANGFVVSVGTEYSLTFDPFLAALQTNNSKSSGIFVEAGLDETPGRISFEWRNMRLEGHPLLDFATFKLNLYDNQVVEFHYGPSEVTETIAFADDNTGPVVIVSLFNDNFTTVYDLLYVNQNPDSPTFVQSSGSLSGVPQPGTLYRFTPMSTTSIEDSQEYDNVEFYPNPTTGIIEVSYPSSLDKPMDIKVYDLSGKEVEVSIISHGSDRSTFELEKSLPDGLYSVVLFFSNDKAYKHKIVKQS